MNTTSHLSYFDLETPCYIFIEEELKKGIRMFRKSLEEKFPKVDIGYSVKTNSLPFILRKADELGCKAEVVSQDEYDLAKLCGFTPRNIIYNGPLKSKDTFIEAIVNGGIVNIETKRELSWLKSLPLDNHYKVGIRLNINISKVSPQDAENPEDNSRFGFSDESNEFKETIDFINDLPNVKLSGLHIHRTAHSRSPRFYSKSVEFAAQIVRKYNLDLDYLDIGGGYFGIFPNKPTFEDYAEAIYNPLKKFNLEYLRIIVEPGNALIAASIKFLSEVIDVKRIDHNTRFVNTDGSRNDIDPFFKKSDYLKEILYMPSVLERPVESLQIIGGCTCLEYDRLFSLYNAPALVTGDRILYNNVGAYTMTLSPLFIRLFPRVYAMGEDGNIKEIRKAWKAENLIQQDLINE